MDKKICNVLFSKQEILDYLGISDHLFRKYILKGLPARFEDSRGIDIINTKLFNIQCKARQNLNVFNVLHKEMPNDANINLVFWKKDRQPDIVCMDKQDFYELLQILKVEQIL